MKGEEKQGVLFDENVGRAAKLNNEQKKSNPMEGLEMGFKPDDKRLFLVDGKAWRLIDSDYVHFLRKMEKISAEPILDEENIKSINLIPESKVACRICVDQPEEVKEEEGISKGTYRIGYPDGEFVMVCERHKPKFEQSEQKLEDHEMTEYTKWIIDH